MRSTKILYRPIGINEPNKVVDLDSQVFLLDSLLPDLFQHLPLRMKETPELAFARPGKLGALGSDGRIRKFQSYD
jgi:hypothetical protein